MVISEVRDNEEIDCERALTQRKNEKSIERKRVRAMSDKAAKRQAN